MSFILNFFFVLFHISLCAAWCLYHRLHVSCLCDNGSWTRNQFDKCVASSHISPNIKKLIWTPNGKQRTEHFTQYCTLFFCCSSYVCNTVSPMIFVPNQLVGAPSGTDVAIDCNTEAHPKYIKNPFLYKILFLFSHALFMIWYVVYFVGVRSTYHATVHMRQFRLRATQQNHAFPMHFRCFFDRVKLGKNVSLMGFMLDWW